MHIWRTKELVEELANEKMSEWEMTQYLIATTVLWALLGGNVGLSEFETLKSFVNIIYAVIGGIGTYYCFTVNRKIDNKDFIIRFTVLSWPVSIRWILIAIIGFVPLSVFYHLSNESGQSTTEQWFMDYYMLVLEVIFFVLLSKYIRQVGESAKKI